MFSHFRKEKLVEAPYSEVEFSFFKNRKKPLYGIKMYKVHKFSVWKNFQFIFFVQIFSCFF